MRAYVALLVLSFGVGACGASPEETPAPAGSLCVKPTLIQECAETPSAHMDMGACEYTLRHPYFCSASEEAPE
jgi:hypothetical protein